MFYLQRSSAMPAISLTQYCCSVDLRGEQIKTGYISASKKKSSKLRARLFQVVFIHMWGEHFLQHLEIVCLDYALLGEAVVVC